MVLRWPRRREPLLGAKSSSWESASAIEGAAQETAQETAQEIAQETAQRTTQKTAQRTTQKEILRPYKEEPKLNRKQLAERMAVTEDKGSQRLKEQGTPPHWPRPWRSLGVPASLQKEISFETEICEPLAPTAGSTPRATPRTTTGRLNSSLKTCWPGRKPPSRRRWRFCARATGTTPGKQSC